MSQKIDIDFVDYPALSLRQFSPWALLLSLLGLLLALLVVKHYQSLNAEYDRMTHESRSEQTQIAKKTETDKAMVKSFTEDELKKIRETVGVLGAPWGQLLDSLENINMKNVALLLLEPNKKKEKVTLTGQAKNIQSMLNYVEEVSALPMLSHVYLQNHLIELDDPNQPVSFTIAANWQ